MSFLLRLGVLLVLAAAPAAAQVAPDPALNPAQRQAVVEILRQALREDPSILRDALAALEADELRERRETAGRALQVERAALLADPADAVRGNPRGDVTIVEFFDVRCGYCRQIAPVLEELLRRDGQLRLVLKDLPILGPNSVLAARALMAAQRQGKYGELHDALMAVRGEVDEAVLRREAERLGLDWRRLRREMDDPVITSRIAGNIALARRLGVEGTPALVIGDRLIGGAVPLEALASAVAEARAGR